MRSYALSTTHGLPLGVGGTLVVAIPTKDGLLIAADSRVVHPGWPDQDDGFKIILPGRPDRTVFATTGTTAFLQGQSGARPLPGADLRRIRRVLDIDRVVESRLRRSIKVTPEVVNAIAADCRSETLAFSKSYPEALRPGEGLFQVVVATYLPPARASVLANFEVLIDQDLSPTLGRSTWDEHHPDHRRIIRLFGEGDYVLEHVIPSGEFFANPRRVRDFVEAGRIGDVTIAEALEVAEELIRATEAATAIAPAPSGIGGPVDAVLLAADPVPVKLRWKKEPEEQDPEST